MDEYDLHGNLCELLESLRSKVRRRPSFCAALHFTSLHWQEIKPPPFPYIRHVTRVR